MVILGGYFMIQIQKHILFALMLSCVGSSFSMNKITPYLSEVKKTAQWISQGYKDKTEALATTLKLPKNTFRVGLPFVGATAFAAGIFYAKSSPEMLEQLTSDFKIGLSCATGLLGVYSAILTKNYFKFERIKKELDNARHYRSFSGNKRAKAFRFFGWAQEHGKSPCAVNHNRTNVIIKFKTDVTCTDQIYFNGTALNPTEKNPVTASDLRKYINNEVKQLKKKLIFVGNCSNVSERLLSGTIAGINWQQRNHHLNILDDNEFWKNVDNNDLKTITTDLKQNVNNAHWFKRYMYYFPGMQFWNFHIAPQCDNAHVKLYCDLLKAYVRLLGIKSIADGMGAWQYDGSGINIGKKKIS